MVYGHNLNWIWHMRFGSMRGYFSYQDHPPFACSHLHTKCCLKADFCELELIWYDVEECHAGHFILQLIFKNVYKSSNYLVKYPIQAVLMEQNAKNEKNVGIIAVNRSSV